MLDVQIKRLDELIGDSVKNSLEQKFLSFWKLYTPIEVINLIDSQCLDSAIAIAILKSRYESKLIDRNSYFKKREMLKYTILERRR